MIQNCSIQIIITILLKKKKIKPKDLHVTFFVSVNSNESFIKKLLQGDLSILYRY